MASPRTFLPGVVTGETALNTIGQRVDRLYDNATPWATVTSGSEPDDVTVSVNSNESGTPQDTAFLERGWLAGMGVRLAWPVTNTGAVTLAVNGGSALNIVTPEGDAIAAGQFPQGLVVELVYYDGDLVAVSAYLTRPAARRRGSGMCSQPRERGTSPPGWATTQHGTRGSGALVVQEARKPQLAMAAAGARAPLGHFGMAIWRQALWSQSVRAARWPIQAAMAATALSGAF
jgi:hypothetical protein